MYPAPPLSRSFGRSENSTAYYGALHEYAAHYALNEGNTRQAFQDLLAESARSHGMTLLTEQTIPGTRRHNIRVDGLVRDLFFERGIWEARDTSDDLEAEPAREIGHIPLATNGRIKHLQSLRYTTLERLQGAKTLDDVW